MSIATTTSNPKVPGKARATTTPPSSPKSDIGTQAAYRRRLTNTVQAYLAALQAHTQRHRSETPEALRARLNSIEEQLADDPEPIRQLELLQRKLDTRQRLDHATDDQDFTRLEGEVKVVLAEWAALKGISYTALRQFGVPTSVLAEAGVRRNVQVAKEPVSV